MMTLLRVLGSELSALLKATTKQSYKAPNEGSITLIVVVVEMVVPTLCVI